MAKVTTKSLYQNILEEIEARVPYTSVSRLYQQAGRGNYNALSYNDISSALTTVSISEVVNAIQTMLAETIPQFIKSGLEVFETSPQSLSVRVTKGSGSVGGNLYTLSSETIVNIPLGTGSEVYYVMLWKDGIYVDEQPDERKVVLARVISPRGAESYKIMDKDDGSGAAYIQMLKEQKLYGYDNKLEEDSIALLRDNIGEILADTLIGNIRLSEDLKITNTQGSLELDSTGIKLFDVFGVPTAKFNKNGTFFYDNSGVEIAKFSTTGARVGNILINTNSLSSSNFVSGNNGQGFQIKDDGTATFENVLIRGELRSAVFRKDEVQVAGGDLIVTNGTILEQPIDETTEELHVKEAVFQDGDILLLKKETQREFLKVVSGGGTTSLTVTRNFDGLSGSSASSWTKGDVIIEYGDRVAIISNGDYAENTPYIDIIKRLSTDSVNDECLYARLGNLEGITDTCFDFVGGVGGYGLYTNNAFLNNTYLRGTLIVAPGDFVPSEDGLYAGGCYLGHYASGGWRSYIDRCGNVLFGDTASGQYMCYDATLGTFRIDSEADGCCVEIKDGVVRANEMFLIDPLCCCNYSYLTSGGWYFHDTLGNSTPYVKRLVAGSAVSGSTIELCGWCTVPKIQVGIKELNSYDASYAVNTQRWCIYNSEPEYFCSAADCWGYCFGVYACLVIAAGNFSECIHDVADGVCVTTNDNTCETVVRTQWRLWCFCSTCSSCYGYGTACYYIYYRCTDSGCAWCTYAASFQMPHATLGEMQSNAYACETIEFTDSGEYELFLCLCSMTWTLTSFSGLQCCLCCRALGNDSSCSRVGGGTTASSNYCIASHNSKAVSVDGSNPTNIYCTYICYTSCTIPDYHLTLSTWGNYEATSAYCVYARIFANSTINCYNVGWGSCLCLNNCSRCVSLGSEEITNICICTLALICITQCIINWNEGTPVYAKVCYNYTSCFCILSGYVAHCYCHLPTNTACCYARLYGTTDCVGADTCLDETGIINYLALSYL